MPEYVAWLKGLPHKPVFVAYPAGFDFTFVYWYLIRICRSHECAISVIELLKQEMCWRKIKTL
jgi:hypothetical protein